MSGGEPGVAAPDGAGERPSAHEPRPPRVLGVFSLMMITTGIITSVNGAPSMAEWGLSLVTIYFVVAVVFLVPSALISAELAAGWPADGGVYVWVREAFGTRTGFLAVWEQFAENAIWFPAILQVTVVTAFYAWDPDLSDDDWLVFVAVNVLFWGLTAVNLLGMRSSSIVATIGTLGGRIVPIVVITGLAVVYLVRGNPSQIQLSDGFLPDLENWGHLSFIIGAFLTFAGIEASASNAASARRPRRDFPIAIIGSAALAFFLVTAVSLAIAVVIPADDLNLVSGTMQAIEQLLDSVNLGALLPVLCLVMAVGIAGEINNWIPGPTRGLLVAGREGALPRWWHHESHRAVHKRILVGQAIFVSVLSLLTLALGVQSAFWVMTVLPTLLYLVMYVLMFAAGVKLRYSQPDVDRQYRVPGGIVGMWVLAVVGIGAALVSIPAGLVPPSTVPDGEEVGYFAVVGIGFVVMLAFPLLLHRYRRPGWRTAGDDEALVGDDADEVEDR